MSVNGPDQGHTFRFSLSMRGSARVGDGPYEDAPSFHPTHKVVEVRAWNLREALEKASALPLAAWFPEET